MKQKQTFRSLKLLSMFSKSSFSFFHFSSFILNRIRTRKTCHHFNLSITFLFFHFLLFWFNSIRKVLFLYFHSSDVGGKKQWKTFPILTSHQESGEMRKWKSFCLNRSWMWINITPNKSVFLPLAFKWIYLLRYQFGFLGVYKKAFFCCFLPKFSKKVFVFLFDMGHERFGIGKKSFKLMLLFITLKFTHSVVDSNANSNRTFYVVEGK